MNRRLLSLALLLFCALTSACSFSTARITSAETARGFSANAAVGVTTTFSPDDNPIHAVVALANAPSDTEVKAIWTAVDAGDGAYVDLLIDETTYTSGDGVIDFQLTNNQAWPAGSYKVEIYLNGELNTTREFTVE